MRLKPFIIAANLLAFFAAGNAQADDVRIRTGFPSPYSTYGQIDVSNDAALATRTGNVQFATGAGASVAVGTATPEAGAQRTLGVRDTTGATPRVGFFHAPNGWGVAADTFAAALGGLQTENGAATGTLALNPFGGNVGVGTANPQYTLHVNGTIGLNDGSGEGQVELVYDGAGGYSHAYAP